MKIIPDSSAIRLKIPESKGYEQTSVADNLDRGV